jgi:formylglycine-generating enzyme required for sulfatase activity
VSRIFLSHSSQNNAQALAVARWLAQEGWDDIFLDLDPERGLKAGERWEEALRDAAHRCEAIIFLVSRAWLGSEWCRDEFRLARHLRKRLFGVLIEDIPTSDLPPMLTREWQVVSIAPAGDAKTFSVAAPGSPGPADVTFSEEGLRRLRLGLISAGLDARSFVWPPVDDADRPPYRGLRPLEAEDAGIFFGRDGPIVEALDVMRGLRASPPPRFLVILGASGAGKSSFLRAALFPRLQRDDRNFLPLPVIRPERAAVSGETGLLSALEGAFTAGGLPVTRADLRAVIKAGAVKLKPLLQRLGDKATPMAPDTGVKSAPPTVVVSIDQAEELFLAEAQEEARPFLELLGDLVKSDKPSVIVALTIRSDNYEKLQLAPELEGVRQDTLSLPPMPKGAYAEVVKGPPLRLQGTARSLNIEDGLVDALLADVEAGGAKDALPLLAFTLERLYGEYHSGRSLKLAHYDALGRIKGSIEAAVDSALKAADADPAIPKDRAARLAVLRRGLIPWLAGIDPDTGAPRRRVARLSEIPAEARPLIQHLVDQRLLATDINSDTGEATIEPAHEALLRQWGLLEGWLTEDAGLLAVLEGVKRGSRDWAASNYNRAWLSHQTDRLAAAERLSARPDLAANLEPTDQAYIAACRKAETDAKRGRRLLRGGIYALLVGIIIGLVGWINQSYVAYEWHYITVTLPYERANVRPHVLSLAEERALKPNQTFRECASEQGQDYCPEMVVVRAGSFVMGSPPTEKGHYPSEDAQHEVTIGKPFAVAKFAVTFDEWDTCANYGDCPQGVSDNHWGRSRRPVIDVTWDDAQRYVVWLSKMTGRPYRLLTEAEYEYATRAGTQTAYPWGDDIGQNNANCRECRGPWYGKQQTAPVGSFEPNAFGLYDMVGNADEWVEDCYNSDYSGAPTDGSAWTEGGDCKNRMARGGSWFNDTIILRSANRIWFSPDVRLSLLGFRVGRTLVAP